MASKNMNARFSQKHDIEANWIKASNFYPLEGEIVIYDPDENYNYPRMKVGQWDGIEDHKSPELLVTNLPFFQIQVDWNQTDATQSDYIKNKPSFNSLSASIKDNILILSQSSNTHSVSIDNGKLILI